MSQVQKAVGKFRRNQISCLDLRIYMVTTTRIATADLKMSLSRRGGFRGGKGGGIFRDAPWAYDPEIKIENKPSELYPVRPPCTFHIHWIPVEVIAVFTLYLLLNGDQDMKIIVPRSLSRIEKLQVSRYRTLRDQIHQGPLYTVLGDNGRISKQGGKLSKAQIDPFNGVQTYTMKYRRQTRRIPRLDGRPYGSLIPSMFETWIY